MKKEVTVVMLSTEKIVENRPTYYKTGISKYIPSHPGGKSSLEVCTTQYGQEIPNPQHLYFVSRENLKVGLYVYSVEYGIGKVILGNHPNYKGQRPYLVKFDNIQVSYNENGGYSDDGKLIYKNDCKVIIASTDESLNLPRPSNEFIRKYCEVNGKIEKVLVEYEEIFTENSEEYVHSTGAKGNYSTHNYKLKVAPDNTITIYPIEIKKKDIFTRKDLIFYVQFFVLQERSFLNMDGIHYVDEDKLEDWIENNLE